MERSSGYNPLSQGNADERIRDTAHTTQKLRPIHIGFERPQLNEQELQIVEEENGRIKTNSLVHLLKSRKSDRNRTIAAKADQRPHRVEKFQVGDVVEQLYNANTVKNRVLQPFQVEELHAGPWEEDDDSQSLNEDSDSELGNASVPLIEARYTIVRLVDGFRVKQIPEPFLRKYVPYSQDSEALCNVGGCGIGKERIVSCTIIEYISPKKPLAGNEEKDVLEAEYRVRIREEEEIVLGLRKLQRRLYL